MMEIAGHFAVAVRDGFGILMRKALGFEVVSHLKLAENIYSSALLKMWACYIPKLTLI